MKILSHKRVPIVLSRWWIKNKTIWSINTLCTDENGSTERKRTVAHCSSLKMAKLFVEGNYGDMYEQGYYPLVLIEPLRLNEMYGTTLGTRAWYAWNKKQQKYIPCECPEQYKHIIGFWE